LALIDRDIHLARALLVDGNAMMRNVTATQLRDAGVGQVLTAGRVKEARLMLEHDRFDIVLCTNEFDDGPDTGQDLLDELRRENLLPHSTVFLMVAEKATYHQVVEAAESALDGLLVRPYTAALLCQRLLEARNRKRQLGDVLRALDAGQTEIAFARALKRFNDNLPYGAYCGRLAAELLLTLQRPADARRVFEKLVQTTGSPWAKLGVARAQMAAGDHSGARQTTQALLASQPDSADAHDLIGRILVEHCDFEGALRAYRAAASLTPGCLLRGQHAGALAFYQGENAEALERLEHTLGLGVQSKLFDALSLVLIALLRFDAGDVPGVLAMRKQLTQFRQRFPESVRLQRLELAAKLLVDLQQGAQEAAVADLGQLSLQVGSDDFDLESANVLISLWSRVPDELVPAAKHEALVERIAMRFCTSKAIGEVLVGSARRAARDEAVIRRCQSQLSRLAEQAMDRALRGDAGSAARDLLAQGETTLNAKLLDIASQIARRHRETVGDADALCARAAAVIQRSCRAGNLIAGIQRSGRSPGGLQVRGRSPTEAASATA
jgi:CheY-like chemotaxis protein